MKRYAGASLLVLAALAAAPRARAAQSDSATSVSELTVTAPRKEDAARVVQLQALNIISVQSAETIAKYPDFNAAEALGRMPGVSLSSDTGEGRFVQIRGIDANLDGATYGGVPLLNTNPGGTESGGGGRAVEFDTIPTGAVDGIIVTYTGMPDHEAEGLGGSIELSPRTAKDITSPFVEGQLGWGYEPLHDHTGPFDAEIAVGARFGFPGGKFTWIDSGGSTGAGSSSNAAPFSFVLTASRRDDRRAVDDVEESYIDQAGAPANAVSQYDLRRYDYHRRRFAFGGEFDFQPNDDHGWYVRGDVAGYIEAVHKNFLLFTNLDAVFQATGQVPVDPSDPKGFLVTTMPTISLTDEQEAHRNQVYAVGGHDQFGRVLVDYHAAFSRATFHVDRNIGAQFAGPEIPITYDNVSKPNFPIFTFPGGTDLNDPGLYSLSGLGNNQDFDVDQEWSYTVNVLVPFHLINDNDRVKFGGEVRLRDKTAIEIDEQSLAFPDLSLSGFADPAITSYYDNHYTNGPQIDRYLIRSLLVSNQVSGYAPMFNPTSYLSAKEDIYAGYAMYTGQIGKLGVLAGVRVEATRAVYGGYIQVTDPFGNITNVLQFRNVDYTDAFPTVQLRYDFTPSAVARLTWSTGIARPGFIQNTTAASVDFTQSPVAITRGNPDLKPTLGNNFDLSLEDYLPSGGIVQVALFDKEFSNYIADRIQNGVHDPLAPGVRANVTTFLNIPSAYARGIQLAYHQKFTFLPDPLDGFGVEANLTLVHSRDLEYTADQSATGVAQNGPLPGTSNVTWNLAGFYEAHRIEARLSAEYVSSSLFGLGGDRSLDTIQDSRLTLDFTSSYRLTNNVSLYFEAKNLLNTPLRYYEGSSNRPIQREFYDITLEGGLRARF